MKKSLKTLSQKSQADQHPTSPDTSWAAFASPLANKKTKHNFQEMGTIKKKNIFSLSVSQRGMSFRIVFDL